MVVAFSRELIQAAQKGMMERVVNLKLVIMWKSTITQPSKKEEESIW